VEEGKQARLRGNLGRKGGREGERVVRREGGRERGREGGREGGREKQKRRGTAERIKREGRRSQAHLRINQGGMAGKWE
jgi:hypothetical protein